MFVKQGRNQRVLKHSGKASFGIGMEIMEINREIVKGIP